MWSWNALVPCCRRRDLSTRVPHVAFATYSASPDLTADDALAADALRSDGVIVSAAAWDDAHVDWSQFDAIVIRSTWNYHHHPVEYAAWLHALHRADGTLWNPAAVVLGNMHKRYLADWAARGVAVIPSHVVPAASNADLPQLLDTRGWDEAVIKPAVSASADGTWRTSRVSARADQPRFARQHCVQDVLVQPYLPDVASRGEWSLVFFAGRFSHAVLKRPAPGDFRVQGHFGGDSALAVPHPDLVAQAHAVLSMIDAPLLYARVDGIDVDGQFMLMELEINEPCLFLGCAPEAPARFSNAIIAAL